MELLKEIKEHLEGRLRSLKEAFKILDDLEHPRSKYMKNSENSEDMPKYTNITIKDIILAIMGGCLIACVCTLVLIKEIRESRDIYIEFGEIKGIHEGRTLVYNELVLRDLGYYYFDEGRIEFKWK